LNFILRSTPLLAGFFFGATASGSRFIVHS
jgi:hypothetical protein